MREYRGLCLGGVKDGAVMASFGRKFRAFAYPEAMDPMDRAGFERANVEPNVTAYKHEEFILVDENGNSEHFGFWVPATLHDAKSHIMRTLIDGYSE